MQGNQAIAILGTLLIVFIVLGVLYESYLHPLTILSTLPSAGAGALLALLLLETEFSLVALLGLFLLIGVVMKNAILMIDVALQREREIGATPEEAIREAALLRLRPILMTTMSALLGALPLMLGTGEGAELRRPLGIAIVGGLRREPGAHALYDARRLPLSGEDPRELQPSPRPHRRRRGRAGRAGDHRCGDAGPAHLIRTRYARPESIRSVLRVALLRAGEVGLARRSAVEALPADL